MKLYTYYRSSCSYRVRIVLNYKELTYESVPVHLLQGGGQQHASDYKELNPMAQVPSLSIDHHSISQSMAICEYLEEIKPTPSLLPAHPIERAKVREFCEIINSGTQPLQNLSVIQFLKSEYDISDEQKLSWIQNWVKKGLQSCEDLTSQHNYNYCLGDKISLADCFLVPQMFSANRFGVNIAEFENLHRVYQQLLDKDFVRNAKPDLQPDFPQR